VLFFLIFTFSKQFLFRTGTTVFYRARVCPMH